MVGDLPGRRPPRKRLHPRLLPRPVLIPGNPDRHGGEGAVRADRAKKSLRLRKPAQPAPLLNAGGTLRIIRAKSGGVSIHAPAWGRQVYDGPIRKAEEFQSTPPRGGDVGVVAVGALCHLVSIHAPAWGRPMQLSDPAAVDAVSIHAPAWGRPVRSSPTCWPVRFNPRPRVGATGWWRGAARGPPRFNPRPRVGATT